MMNKTAIFFIAIYFTASVVFAVTNKEINALKKIMPEAVTFSDKKSLDGIEYFEAFKDKNLIGYCISTTANGYCGRIHILFGIDKSGVIQGMEILENTDTAGVGSLVSQDNFTKQFKGKYAACIAMGKDIDAVTGASISSNAVIDSMRGVAEKFLSSLPGHKPELQKNQ